MAALFALYSYGFLIQRFKKLVAEFPRIRTGVFVVTAHDLGCCGVMSDVFGAWANKRLADDVIA